MVSIEAKFKKLRVEEVQGVGFGEKTMQYKGVPSTAILRLNAAGAESLVSRGHRSLTSGDEVCRGDLAAHDSPRQKEIAFRIKTKLHQPVEEEKDDDNPLSHLRNVEVFPVGADWFQ